MLTKNSHGWCDCGPTEAKHAQVIFKTEAAACVALKMHGMMSASFEAQLQHCSCAEAKRSRHGLARAIERNQGSGGRFRGSKLRFVRNANYKAPVDGAPADTIQPEKLTLAELLGVSANCTTSSTSWFSWGLPALHIQNRKIRQ